MTNHTILETNVLGSLQTRQAQNEFLWAAGRHDADRYRYVAERHAREVDQVVAFLAEPLLAASKLHDLADVPDGLVAFVVQRIRHKNFPI